MRVITYQHAYIGGTTTLCEEHAVHPPEWVPSLGPVSHGQHEGECDACDEESECDVAQRLDAIYEALATAGYECSSVSDERLILAVRDVGGDDPKAEESLLDIRSIVAPFGAVANWTGNGNGNYSDVYVELTDD